MTREQALEMCREQMEENFDFFFKEKILKGRQPMIADISHRNYPYTDIVRAYSHGIFTGVAILEQLMKEDMYDDEED